MSSGTTTPPLPDSALVDDDILEEMRAAIRPGEFERIIQVFLDDTRSRIERTRGIHAAGRMADLADECHDLASTLGTFGAFGPMAVAREVMGAAKAGDTAKVGRLVPDLLDMTERMADMLSMRFGTASDAG